MEGRLLFQDCAVLEEGGRASTSRSVVIEMEAVVAVKVLEHAQALPGDWVVSCRGRLLTPPLREFPVVDVLPEVTRLRAAEAVRRGVSPFGTAALAPLGTASNLVLWDLVPASGKFVQPAHLRAAWVVEAGAVRLREGELLGIDFLSLANEAARAVEARAQSEDHAR